MESIVTNESMVWTLRCEATDIDLKEVIQIAGNAIPNVTDRHAEGCR
jgi:hypothetical protein